MVHMAGALGGAERTTENLLRNLDRSLTGEIVLVSTPLLEPVFSGTQTRFVNGDELGLGAWFDTPGRLRRDALALAAVLRRETPDCVMGVMHYGAALAALAASLCRPRPRVIASLRGPVFEHMRHYERGAGRRLFLRLAVGATGRLSSRVLVPSAGTGAELTRHFLVPAKRVSVIPNGIDMDLVDRARAAPTPDLSSLDRDVPLLCTAARLSEEKRLGSMLEAFRRVVQVRPARLLIVGEGVERPALERMARDWGIGDSVTFVGYRQNAFPYVARADLFLHTCAFEGFGYAVLEALACGTPVVATDCPYGPREVLGDNRFGILTPPDDPQAMAGAVLDLLADPQRRRRLAEAGRERAKELSVQRMVRGYERVLRELGFEATGGEQ